MRLPAGGGTSRHSCPFSDLADKHLVIEEKVDGSHRGVFFDADATLQVSSRNTILDPSHTGCDFRLLHEILARGDALWHVLEDRYVRYGEWAHCVDSVFYDALPSFFFEDDLYDRHQECFLSTEHRRELTVRLPSELQHSVAVLGEGEFHELEALHGLLGPSMYKSDAWRVRCEQPDAVEQSKLGEGLYIKYEHDGVVRGRFKWVRPEFLAFITATRGHWRDRDPWHNRLAEDDPVNGNACEPGLG